MKDSTHFGMNKTGVHMAPIMSERMIEGTKEFPPVVVDRSLDAVRFRQDYIQNSGEVGTMPIPGTIRGAVSSGIQKITGQHPEVFIDKLGERMAYERSGVRFYDALLTKCQVLLPEADLDLLRKFQSEEAEHFHMLREIIESFGADSTAQTPCADVSGVASLGLLQVVTDPRTTVPQCVEALLIVELADNDAWELLIHMANQNGMKELVDKFNLAKSQEDTHLMHLRSWLQQLVSKNEGVPLQ